MPLDMTTQDNFIAEVPENLTFKTVFEPTLFKEKKYVINGDTGEYIGVVGKSFNCADHQDFFYGVQNVMTENLPAADLKTVDVSWRTARDNAWALMDLKLTDVSATIRTDKHETVISPRIIALHGIDGSASNQVFFGKIDFFCTNGMINGEYDKVRRKNTSNFQMNDFIRELAALRSDFYVEAQRMQRWADTPLKGWGTTSKVQDMLESIIKSERKAKKMTDLYYSEAKTRGHNVFALYSAFTNYASYADSRNGFTLRNTGNDTASESMWKREQEVSKWISTTEFNSLLAA